MSHLIPGVLERIDPIGGLAPVVFDSPHSGNVYPKDFGHAIDRFHLRQTEDAFIDELFAAAPERGAVLLHALFPRSYVDANRAPDDIDPSLLLGKWPFRANPGEKARLGVGLIPTREPGGMVYDRKLTVEEAIHRLDGYYWPYHHELQRLLNDIHAFAGGVWHVNCHSMPQLSTSVSPEGPGVVRPDFCLGTRDGTTCDVEFANVIRECLTEMGYQVTVNDPYKGVELVRRYSDPASARHSVQIEINRNLYMDETRIEKNEGFVELEDAVTRMVGVICDYARSRVGAGQSQAAE